MRDSKMQATGLRGLLITLLILIVGLAGVGFYFTQSWLRGLAITVSHTVVDSHASDNNVSGLQKLQADLAQEQQITTKAGALLASPDNYQAQAIKDIDAYGLSTGVSIQNYTFASDSTTSATTVGTTPAAATVGGAATSTVTVTIASPVQFTSLMKFMMAIERNLPKMQISSINLSRSTDGSSVTTDALTIEIYT
jgi:hypothetical protein